MKLYLWNNGDITGSEGKGRPPEKLIEQGKMKKSYSISNTDYRYILSAGVNLQKVKKFKLKFITLTFPFDVNEHPANQILTHFLNKLKRNYGNFSYIWTKERQQNGKIHFHALCDLPFIPVKSLQSMYNDSICVFVHNANISNNSLRLPPKSHNVDSFNNESIVKYMAKYISKERGRQYEKPCFAISRDLRDVKREISLKECAFLIKKHGIFKSFGDRNYGVTMLKNR